MNIPHGPVPRPWSLSAAPGARRLRSQAGFTLIELVMVIVLVGALAVFAAPRIFGSSDFNIRGFHDETIALLRFAQKSAIAERRTVCVTFGAAGAMLTVAAVAGTPSCSVDLTGPRGEAPASITARSGVGYSPTPAAFNFDALGQPRDAAGSPVGAQTVQVAGASRVITVEGGTGYVHD